MSGKSPAAAWRTRSSSAFRCMVLSCCDHCIADSFLLVARVLRQGSTGLVRPPPLTPPRSRLHLLCCSMSQPPTH